MKVLISEKLSEHKYKTPEGYLICTDAILARTGKQSYTKDELFQDGDNTEVNVDRPYDEVMNVKTIASFENKPITFDHPDEDVNVGNYKDYAIGYVRDVHQGKTDKGEDVILGNLVITDQDAINAIEQGDHTDLSCGYDCDIRDDGNGNYSQTNIRGNHLALCEQGRAGIAHIVDSKARDSKIEKVPPELLLNLNYWFSDKLYIEKKYHVKIYNITSNQGLTITGSRQDLEKLYKDYNLEDGYHLKIVDSKIKDEMNYSEEMKAVRNALRHIVVDNKSEMKQLIQDLIDNKPMNYSLEVRRLKRAIDELIKWSDNRQEGIDTIWAIAKENRIVDNKIDDMAVWQLKPETNLDKLSVAITNNDISSLKAMLNIVNKDIDDYNKNYDELSNSDKLMLKKRFGKLVEKMNRLGVRTHTLRLDSKEMTISDAIKMLNIVDAYKKATTAKDSISKVDLKRGIDIAEEKYGYFDFSQLKEEIEKTTKHQFSTRELYEALKQNSLLNAYINRLFGNTKDEDSTKDGRLWQTLTRKAKH